MGMKGKTRVVSSLEILLDAGRRAKCQTCRIAEVITIKLKSLQNANKGFIFLVNSNFVSQRHKKNL